MKAFKKTLCIAAAVATTLLPLGSAMAQDIKSRTIKFAFQNQGEHPQAQGAKKFADLVAAKSGDKMKVRTMRAAFWAAICRPSRRCRAARSR